MDIVDNWEQILKLFDKGTKSETVREAARIILNYLTDKRADDIEGGWVRSSDIYRELVQDGKIPHRTQFHRVMNGLVQYHIVEKKSEIVDKRGPGKTPVYYRIPIFFTPLTWRDREELREDIEYQSKYIQYLLERSLILDDIRQRFIPDNHDLAVLLGVDKWIPNPKDFKMSDEELREADIDVQIESKIDSDDILNYKIMMDRKNPGHLGTIGKYGYKIRQNFVPLSF